MELQGREDQGPVREVSVHVRVVMYQREKICKGTVPGYKDWKLESPLLLDIVNRLVDLSRKSFRVTEAELNGKC
jgi:hypothetical protein